jgi:hypothetical protein
VARERRTRQPGSSLECLLDRIDDALDACAVLSNRLWLHVPEPGEDRGDVKIHRNAVQHEMHRVSDRRRTRDGCQGTDFGE